VWEFIPYLVKGFIKWCLFRNIGYKVTIRINVFHNETICSETALRDGLNSFLREVT